MNRSFRPTVIRVCLPPPGALGRRACRAHSPIPCPHPWAQDMPGHGGRTAHKQGCSRREGIPKAVRRAVRQAVRRLEEVAKAVGGGYCRLQMPLKPALRVRVTVAGHRLGALEGVPAPPPMHPWTQGPPGPASSTRTLRPMTARSIPLPNPGDAHVPRSGPRTKAQREGLWCSQGGGGGTAGVLQEKDKGVRT